MIAVGRRVGTGDYLRKLTAAAAGQELGALRRGAHGVLDENVVLSALVRPRQRWSYDETPDLSDLAASYLVGLARSQGFNDGNKRTGLACALLFLALNGREVDVSSGALYAITMAVATNSATDAHVSAFLREALL